MLRLALAALALLLFAVPPAAADVFQCQPHAAGTTCVYVWTQTTDLGAATCTYTGVVSACLGGSHDEAPGDIRNVVGGGVCTSTGVCAGVEAGQFSIGSLFIVGGTVGAYSPQATASASNYAGASSETPWRSNRACASTVVTGGTCLTL